jgi:16S rRNA (cytosine967-C5)-methyltransferase
MTPAARHAAAIEILDDIAAGNAAEACLTRWARGSRYAGSKDRAAVRDIVFDVLRRRASCAWLGGGVTGRALVQGLVRLQGADPDAVFTGQGHAPATLEAAERSTTTLSDAPRDVRMDMPDWLLDLFDASWGPQADDLMVALGSRAPVGLRANLRKGTRADLLAELSSAGVPAVAHSAAATAIVAPAGTRGLVQLPAYTDGRFELQDPGSQGLVARLPVQDGMRILDYCAGGGGKSLAMAANRDVNVTAYDIDPKRMSDLPVRAARAGVQIAITTDPAAGAPYDGIVADVPCSGTGAWRRSPEARWTLTQDRFAELLQIQKGIIRECLGLLTADGWLAYMTCSLLKAENDDLIAEVLSATSGIIAETRWQTTPLNDTDGFFLQVLRKTT